MRSDLNYKSGIFLNPDFPRLYGNLSFGVINEDPELGILGELPGPNGTNDYILECIGNMHKVMREGWCYEKKYRATKKLPDGRWDPNSTEEYLEKSDHADIGSGENCDVSLYKDKCIVYDGFNKTETEVDPQSFYQMMCDWEKAIHRWEEERIEMMIEEKKKPYFKEYLMQMYLDSLKTMLEREIEITKEEAKKHRVREEELREKLKTGLLERIVELEREKNNMSYGEWITQKEMLIDEYLGVKK